MEVAQMELNLGHAQVGLVVLWIVLQRLVVVLVCRLEVVFLMVRLALNEAKV